MARRANDPNLLRAQAQSGREGADAYHASQQQLRGQQQAAVQAAMQAAALRGAPGAAVAQMGRQIGRPYNQAIGNLGMMGNTFRQDMTARAGRLDDYNQAVLAARALIPLQIQQAVAPIRAQNRFQLQQLRQEGANRVGEIEANTELQLAQMRAAAQAERIRRRETADANAPTLTQSEMAAALETGAADILSNAQAQAQQIVQRNQLAMRQDPDVQSTLSEALAAREAARWAYAATTGEEQRQAMLPDETTQTAASDLFSHIRPPQPQGASAIFDYTQPPITTGQAGSASSLFGYIQPEAQGSTAAGGQPSTLDELTQQFESASAAHQLAEAPYFSTETGSLTMPQLSRLAGRFGDLTGPLIESAQQNPINSPRDVAEIMGGQPAMRGLSAEGVPNLQVLPSSTESFRQAMELAAVRLGKQGYEFGGPEIQLGMQQNQGQTLANYSALQRGEPPIPEQIKAARDEAERQYQQQIDAYEAQAAAQRQGVSDQYRYESAGRAQGSAERAAAAEDRRQAAAADAATDAANKDDIFAETGGVTWTPSLGPLDLVHDLVMDPDSGIVAALQRIDAEIQSRASEEGEDFVFDIDAVLDELGIINPLIRRLAKAKYGG